MACEVPAVLYDVSASAEIQPEFMRRGIAERHHYGDTTEIIGEIANSVTPEQIESLI